MAAEWLTVSVLALPHILYGFIWSFPNVWRSYFQKESVQVFERAAWALKVAQASAAVYWLHTNQPKGFTPLQVELWAWAAFIVLAGLGQSLNIGIYRAIGHEGVYYGFKLGHKIPWVNGFPFNIVRHPQYVGTVMTIWGVVALLWSQAPSGLALLATYWTLLYAITAIQESYFH